jgi:hypothetical protein
VFAGMSSAFAEQIGMPEQDLLEVLDDEFIPKHGDPLVDIDPATEKYGESRYLAFTADQLELLREVIEEVEENMAVV